MSRIGRKPVAVPAGVAVAVEGCSVTIKGPRGELSLEAHPDMAVAYDREAGVIRVDRPSDGRNHRALHGLTRSLIANMVEGVTRGFSKRLLIQGVGYGAKVEGGTLALTLGFAHPVKRQPPPGVAVEAPSPTTVVVSGCDKQKVGQFAAEVRAVFPAEPYKQKGIRYEGEVVRKKAGKTFAGGAT